MNKGLRCSHQEDPFDTDQLDRCITRRELLVICNLNKMGLNMYRYLLKEGYVYKGRFLIMINDYLKATGQRSKKSFYLGIDELIKWDIIAKSDELNFYYFNIKYFDYDTNN